MTEKIHNSILIIHDGLLYHIVTCDVPGGRSDNKQRDLGAQQNEKVFKDIGEMKAKQEFTEVFRKRFMWFNQEDRCRATKTGLSTVTKILPPSENVEFVISNALTDKVANDDTDEDTHTHTWENAENATCTLCCKRDAYKHCNCGTACCRDCGIVFGFGTAHPVMPVWAGGKEPIYVTTPQRYTSKDKLELIKFDIGNNCEFLIFAEYWIKHFANSEEGDNNMKKAILLTRLASIHHH